MQLRPASVPKAARFSRNEGWWQVGEVRDGLPFGRWRTFRADGSPLFEARFDAKGRLQGTFRRFHSDGSIARDARYAHGKPKGEHVYYRGDGDLFPCGDARVHRVVVRHDNDGDETERVLLDAAGREIPDEPDHVAGALDPVVAPATPDGFTTSTALPAILASLGTAPPRDGDDFLLPVDAPARRWMTPERFAELYGKPMPADLRAWRQIGDPKLVGIRTVRDDDIVTDGSVIEALIAEHQLGPGRFSALRELVAGLFAIGEADDSRYCVALCEIAAEKPTEAVYVLHPAANTVDLPDARTLDDLAFAVVLGSALDSGVVSVACAKSVYPRLQGRVDLRPPLRGMHDRLMEDDDDTEIAGDEAGDHRQGFWFRRGQQAPGFYFYRSRWLLRLVSGNAIGAAADFHPKYDGGLDDERYKRIRAHAPKEPWVAFYWLFRSLAFADARLDDLLRACGDTPSRLVREIAALVGELAEGRRKLGAVDDFGAVLRQFRALDPQSNKNSDDSDDGDGDNEVERPSVPAGLEAAAAVIDWARHEGYEREGLLIRDEVDVAGLGLALRADPQIVQTIIAFVDETSWLGQKFLEPWLDGGRIAVAELLPVARRWLGEQDLAKWELAAQIVEAAGAAEDAVALGKVLEPIFDELFGHRGGGFDAALGRMNLEDGLLPMCAALGRLGIPEAIVPAFEAAVIAEAHHQDDSRGPSAFALALSGKGLDSIVDGVRRMIAADRADHVSYYQLVAIGMLGRGLDEARRRELASLVASLEDLKPFHAAGQAVAAYDLSGDGAPIAAVRDGLAAEGWRDEITTAQRVTLLRLVEDRPDFPAELALPYVVTYDIRVHRAAVRTLRKRGVEVPPYTVYDPFHLATLDRNALEAGLDDPRGVYRSNVALWLGDHPDPETRAALVRSARRCAAEPEFPDDGPRHYELRWAVRALIAIGGADDVLVELLCHANRHIAEPVLRYADKLGPAIAKGMAHVFVHDQAWRKRTAKSWLAKHRRDPDIATALEAYGLAVEDVSRRDREDDE